MPFAVRARNPPGSWRTIVGPSCDLHEPIFYCLCLAPNSSLLSRSAFPAFEKPSSCHETCGTIFDGTVSEGRVCDHTCEDGNPYGTRGCNASGGVYGAHCRSCFYSAEAALAHDTHTERAIM